MYISAIVCVCMCVLERERVKASRSCQAMLSNNFKSERKKFGKDIQPKVTDLRWFAYFTIFFSATKKEKEKNEKKKRKEH